MKLIYIYIEKYRLFENTGINMTNEFIVNYDPKCNELIIERNSNYINLYPDNINEISAIVGKNASGKTSLLDLIGLKIENRFENKEMIRVDEKNPHEKFDLLNLKPYDEDEKIEYTSNYFFVYYNEIIEEKETFILETNNPKKFYRLVKGYKYFEEQDIAYKNKLQYYKEKSWVPIIFELINNKPHLIISNEIHQYNIDNYLKNTCVILFKNTFRNKFPCHFFSPKDEPRISVSRRHAELKSEKLYNQLTFLIEQMKTNSTDLYSDNTYTLNIQMKTPYIQEDLYEPLKFEEDLIHNYKNSNLQDMTEQQKIILSFVYSYSVHLYNINIRNRSEIQELTKSVVKITITNGRINANYNDTLTYYYEIIEKIYDSSLFEGMKIANFKSAVKSFENLFRNRRKSNIKISFSEDNLRLSITSKSVIVNIKDFFDCCVDEFVMSNEKRKKTIMGDFFDAKIEHLSDGELEYLSVFTAINEQLAFYTNNKTKYILLFDEIERAMHPEMCRRLVLNLVNFLDATRYKNKYFQIIISSHSPFITSDLLNSNVISLSRTNKCITISNNDKATFGQNIHTLLKNEFFMDKTVGEFALNKINKIYTDLINYNSNNALTYCDTSDTFVKYRELINLIGEPLVKDKLIKLYKKVFPDEKFDECNNNCIEEKTNKNMNDKNPLYEEDIDELKRSLEKSIELLNKLYD